MYIHKKNNVHVPYEKQQNIYILLPSHNFICVTPVTTVFILIPPQVLSGRRKVINVWLLGKRQVIGLST